MVFDNDNPDHSISLAPSPLQRPLAVRNHISPHTTPAL
jgi:hypothetical protein